MKITEYLTENPEYLMVGLWFALAISTVVFLFGYTESNPILIHTMWYMFIATLVGLGFFFIYATRKKV